MRRRPLGNSGTDAATLAFGAWAIGGWQWGGTDDGAAIDAIAAAIEGGVDLIDTAPVYGFGHSERLVGKALVGRSRDTLRIATKCGLRWDRVSERLHMESDGRRIYRCLAPDSIREELDTSLERLGTDYVDLYQTHWPDPHTPPETVLETLQALRESGRVRALGFCNAPPDALDMAASSGLLDCDQERYSLLDRGAEEAHLPLCRRHDLAFLAYSPLARGLLTGKSLQGRSFAEGDQRRDNPRFAPEALEMLTVALSPLKSLARERQATLAQIVLAWTLQRPGVTHVLVGARNAEQAEANARAALIALSDDELALIDAVADAWPGFGAVAGSSSESETDAERPHSDGGPRADGTAAS